MTSFFRRYGGWILALAFCLPRCAHHTPIREWSFTVNDKARGRVQAFFGLSTLLEKLFGRKVEILTP